MIPVEAVEAAAKAAYISHNTEPGFDAELAWDDMEGTEDWERGQWEMNARAALEAAASILRAEWERERDLEDKADDARREWLDDKEGNK